MRLRLEAVLIGLMVVVVAALAVPLLLSVAEINQQRMLADRVVDARRLASIAQQASTPVDQDALLADMRRYHLVYGIKAAVFDRDAIVLMAADPGRGWVDPEVTDLAAAALLGQRAATQNRIWPWDDRGMVVAEPVVSEGDVVGAVVTVSPTDQLRASVAQFMALLGVVVVATLIGSVVVASKLTNWVLRPVVRLDHAAREIGAGRLVTRVLEASGPPELRHLQRTFNEMAARVQKASERQRSFVADASHQLRNPLNALLLRIDQLQHVVRPGHERSHEHVRAEARRLTRILDDLLELARMEGSLPPAEDTNVTMLVTARVRAWQPVARRRAIALELRGSEGEMALVAPTALGTALDAVLDNALKFTLEDGRVCVAVEGDDTTVTVTVTDNGPGLAAHEVARATDRFWRSPRHQNVPGTGLGLSIARALLGHYAGRVDVAPNPAGGLVVSLTVPVRA